MKKSATKLVKNLALSGFLASVSIISQAAIIDYGSYFTDTDSGLDWLDVAPTVNRSFEDISSKFSTGGEFAGWRYASGAEFASLLSTRTGISGPPNTQIFTTGTTPSVDSLVTLFGSTLDTFWVQRFGQTWDSQQGFAEGEGIDYTLGMIADVFNNDDTQRQVAAIWDNDGNGQALDFYNAMHRQLGITSFQYDIGSFLVRGQSDQATTVSEPNNIFLIALGLFGLVISRRKNTIV